jgi:hypothetical protein
VNIQGIALETFEILRSFDMAVMLYDEDGKQVYEPSEAIRFYSRARNLLVSVVENNEDSSVRLWIGKSADVDSMTNLINALRTMSTKYNVVFNVRKWSRDKLELKDVAKTVMHEGRSPMYMFEGLFGTSRSSYLKLENARMIVRHSARINENVVGARGRDIETIHIENDVGERILFPTNNLAPARAMTHHVDNGGTWADPIGDQIMRMAQDFANLGAANRHIYSAGDELTEAAHEVRHNVRVAIKEMRRVFECMCRKTSYQRTVEALLSKAQKLTEAEVDYSGKVAEMASLLNTQTRHLDESVLTSIVTVLEDEEVKKKIMPPRESSLELISVMGRKVNKPAWEAFKQRQLDLTPALPSEDNPNFSNPMTEVIYRLSELAVRCRDDSMMNLLSFVSDQLPYAKGDMRNKLLGVALYALRIAKIPLTAHIAPLPAVDAYKSWADRFKFESAMYHPNDPSAAAGKYSDAVDDIADQIFVDFSPEDFIEQNDELNWNERNELTGEEKVVSNDTLLSSLEYYLEKIADTHYDIQIGMEHEAKQLLPKVVKILTDAGYEVVSESDFAQAVEAAYERDQQGKTEVNEGEGEETSETEEDVDIDEDFDLTDEDVLIPSDQTADLLRDVEKSTVHDPDTNKEKVPDDGYVNRLQTLAGVKRTY